MPDATVEFGELEASSSPPAKWRFQVSLQINLGTVLDEADAA